MTIKIFTENSEGKITLTRKELEEVLNDAYWEGYNNGSKSKVYTWTSPSYPYYSITSTSGGITISSNNDSASTISGSSITLDTTTAVKGDTINAC